MTYREMVYIIIDLCKLQSDDTVYTEEHLVYLINKYRALILKREYSKKSNMIHSDNYQTICLDVERYKEFDDECSELLLRSTEPMPNTILDNSIKITTVDTLNSSLSYTTPERFQYITANPFTRNIIHTTKNYDNYVYLKSANPQFSHLKYIKVTAVFSDPSEAYDLDCSNNDECDFMDKKLPLEDSLVSILQEALVKIIQPSSYMVEDTVNNASDDLQNSLNPNSRNAAYHNTPTVNNTKDSRYVKQVPNEYDDEY